MESEAQKSRVKSLIKTPSDFGSGDVRIDAQVCPENSNQQPPSNSIETVLYACFEPVLFECLIIAFGSAERQVQLPRVLDSFY